MAGEERTVRDERTLWFLNSRVTVRVASTDGSDGITVLDFQSPGGDAVPLHVHRNEDEIFHVLEGEFRFLIDREETTLSAGDVVLAPKGVPHTYRVESPDGGRFLTITRRGDFERFVRAFSRVAETPGLPEPSGPPTPAQAEALETTAREYGVEIVGPPLD